MQLICSSCSTPIPPAEVNIGTDLAKCTACGAIHKASSLPASFPEKSSDKPPAGGRLGFTRTGSDQYELIMPKKGFTLSDLFPLFFLCFWFAFITFWTWGAAQGSIFFALFSIPFWAVGLYMLISTLNNIFESQTINITHNGLTLYKKRMIVSRKYDRAWDEIHDIAMQPVRNKTGLTMPNSHSQRSIEKPAILSGSLTIYFFENATDAEMDWSVRFLKNKLQKKKETR